MVEESTRLIMSSRHIDAVPRVEKNMERFRKAEQERYAIYWKEKTRQDKDKDEGKGKGQESQHSRPANRNKARTRTKKASYERYDKSSQDMTRQDKLSSTASILVFVSVLSLSLPFSVLFLSCYLFLFCLVWSCLRLEESNRRLTMMQPTAKERQASLAMRPLEKSWSYFALS
jgi:hypothetical protein